jgi:hypothetical protein
MQSKNEQWYMFRLNKGWLEQRHASFLYEDQTQKSETRKIAQAARRDTQLARDTNKKVGQNVQPLPPSGDSSNTQRCPAATDI